MTCVSPTRRVTRGSVARITSFSQAAEEAGRSRIYGGIHFEFDNRAGLQSGRAVAQYIFDHYLKPVSTASGGSVVTQTAYRPTPNEAAAATVDSVVAQCSSVPILYYEPVVCEFQPDVAIPQPVVTYYVFSDW